ncbi:eCIS core domain-containing protein [Aurantivibrio plasticivorans]
MHYGQTNWLKPATALRKNKPAADINSPEQHDAVREVIADSTSGKVQPKLAISQPTDLSEQQADRVAEAVVSNRDQSSAQNTQINRTEMPKGPRIDRVCNECEEELHRKPNGVSTPSPTSAPQMGTGEPIPDNLKRYFEPRFGADFSQVRLHRDSGTADYASSINARAFTYGNHIGFANGQFGEDTQGKKLLAHELTHVIQQNKLGSRPPISSESNQTLNRSVSSSSLCPDGVNGAPPSAEIFITLTEMLVSSSITMANLRLTFDIQALESGNRPTNSKSFNAYLLRFGLPEQLDNGKYKERFSGSQFDTEDEAILSELRTIKARLTRIQRFFDRSIRYLCTSDTANTRVGSCNDSCDGAFAWVCTSGGAPRTIVLCPAFWSMSAQDRAIGLIHEVSHLLFGFGDPSGASMTTSLRGRNPVCYSGFVASTSDQNPPDPDCPVLPLPSATSETAQPDSAVQPKLTIGDANSPQEKQADAVADAVVGNSVFNSPVTQYIDGMTIHRLCDECEEELHRQPTTGKHGNSKAEAGSPPLTGGRPMSTSTRQFFEPRFRHDFSQVKIHDNPAVHQYAASINAKAFTYKNNIGFGQGQNRDDDAGKKLLAHELTHVIQQNAAGNLIQRQDVEEAAEPESTDEHDSDLARGEMRIRRENSGAWVYTFNREDVRTWDDPEIAVFRVYMEHAFHGMTQIVVDAWLADNRGGAGLRISGGIDPRDEQYGSRPLSVRVVLPFHQSVISWLETHYSTIVPVDVDGGVVAIPPESVAIGGGVTVEGGANPDAPGTAQANAEGTRTPLRPDHSVMEGDTELSVLYLLLMEHFTSLAVTDEMRGMASNGLTPDELQAIIGDDSLREMLTMLFTQGWVEFQRAGGEQVDIFGSLIERIIEQFTRGNINAQSNLLRIGFGIPERNILGIAHRNNGMLLYDDLGLPLRGISGIAWRDHGFVGFAVTEDTTREAMESDETMSRDEAIDRLVGNLFAQALGTHESAMVAQGVDAAMRHIDEVKVRVERGLLPEVIDTIEETIGVLIFFMVGHAFSRSLISRGGFAALVGVGLEVALRAAGYIFGVQFLSDSWEALRESAFHLSRVREDEEGNLTALSEVHLDQAAAPVRQLINLTAAAMTFGVFARVVRGVRNGRRARWGRQRGRLGDWRSSTLALRLMLEVGRGVREGTQLESGYGGTTVEAPRVEAPSAEVPQMETPQVEAPRVEAPAAEAAPVETPRVETPATETTAPELSARARAARARTGDGLVRLFLAEPETFDANSLTPQQRQAMLEAFMRNPDAYVEAAETEIGDSLLSRLVAEMRGETTSQPSAEVPAEPRLESSEVPSTADANPVAESAYPQAAPEIPVEVPVLDPATQVTVNTRSNIYYPPGVRYHGSTGRYWESMTLAEAEARGARATRLQPTRAAPPSGVYEVERPSEGLARVVLRAWLGRREARAGLERLMFSAGEYAVQIIQGWQRAHASGAGVGAESGRGIRLAPEFVNQILQNRGIERFLRRLRDQAFENNGQVHVTTIVETHPLTLRLRSITYRIEMLTESGRMETLGDVTIDVTPEGHSTGSVRAAGSDAYASTPTYDVNGNVVEGGGN